MIPVHFHDLVECPPVAALSTVLPSGYPQTSVVWCDYDGDYVLVNTRVERQHGRNLAANSKVSLLVVDPDNTARFIQIRGDTELVREARVTCRIHARRITVDAIHAQSL